MQRFILEVDHVPEECLRLLDSIMQAGAHYLRNTDWGCRDGVHSAWIIVEAEDHNDARLMVPPALRANARIVGLNKFTPEDIRGLRGQAERQ